MDEDLLASCVPALEARGIWKTFDRVRYVLEDVSLAVEPRELVVIMGRSGSGKTTLLNLLCGLDGPTRGEILVGGTGLEQLDEDGRTKVRLRHIGVVFQRFFLIPELTVRENVMMPMVLAHRADARARANQLLAFFGIDDLADSFPATLSGGETQRTALARALANQPAVVLADEPTANLDQANAERALLELRRVATELGTAVVVASHDPLAAQHANRVLQLVDGRISGEAVRSIAPA